ncbi:MAG: Fic family protein [Alistipes sp.]|uniref:Fic family protein n=1 Tax=Alistipes sp. TaxID=1872444 RepID=UPI0025C19DB9|nr:Fic family protein [Alistipes sp.]MCD8276137.1 Fic family protein [Alistipes sp.]
MTTKEEKLAALLEQFDTLGIDRQIDYDKFYLYSLITHSTAIEGSTVTELENQLLFDEGISAKGRSMAEQLMNLDLKAAYERSIAYAKARTDLSVGMLCELSACVMKNTGTIYNTPLGRFSSAAGDLRLLNVTAGAGGRSYMNFQKVPGKLEEFCQWLNMQRRRKGRSALDSYYLSFDAHLRLVTIHPWADGNGRMARLLMNQLQFESGLLPSKILREHKAEYIEALIAARDREDESIFRDFMLAEHIRNIEQMIGEYCSSMENSGIPAPDVRANVRVNVRVKTPRQQQILDRMHREPSVTVDALAAWLQVNERTIRRDIAALRKAGSVERIGADKNGVWIVAETIPE